MPFPLSHLPKQNKANAPASLFNTLDSRFPPLSRFPLFPSPSRPAQFARATHIHPARDPIASTTAPRASPSSPTPAPPAHSNRTQMTRLGGLLLLLLLMTMMMTMFGALHAVGPEEARNASGEEEEVAAAAATPPQLLPRPLVIQLPTERDGGGEEDEAPVEVRCASWRVAGEANNLSPWRAVPQECAAHVRRYVTGPAYRSDLEAVAREASAYARAARSGDGGRDAWVFDVDETLLSNLPYYADHGYGLELFDHREFDKWVEKGEAPAIPSSLRLYREVRELGFKTFLLTGRSEGHEGVTVDNLKKQGFHDWDKLILRAAADRKKTATAYKSEKRKEMEAEGYKILGNSGDQWSDLLGYSMSARSFKLPNPMYYIP